MGLQDSDHKPTLADILRAPSGKVKKGMTKGWFLNAFQQGKTIEIVCLDKQVDLSEENQTESKKLP